MKVLIVCRSKNRRIAPFIEEQVIWLRRIGLEIDCFFIQKSGIWGYLGARKLFLHKIQSFQPNLIHAHYGLTGLFANLQRTVPVVTTFHGSDINSPYVLPFSRFAMLFSSHSIFVSTKQQMLAGKKLNQSVIPCGVDTELFQPMSKKIAREKLGWEMEKKVVLFAGGFHDAVKNYKLAKVALDLMPGVTLLELRGYDREQVVLLMNAVDAVLMTSFSEGSPQFIKEAMACNSPIVSVEVGDVLDLIENTKGCYIVNYNAHYIAQKLQILLKQNERTSARKRIVENGLDACTIAQKVSDVYCQVLKSWF